MLKQRIITALALVIALGAILHFVPVSGMWLIFALIVALAGWEWGGLLSLSSGGRITYGAALFVACAGIRGFGDAVNGLLLASAVAFWLIVVPLWLHRRWSIGSGLVGLVVGGLVLVATWVAFSMLYERGVWYLLCTMALVWVADISAYFAGRRFGKHKLAPAISPGKTWEGVWGAILGVLLYGIGLAPGITGWEWPMHVALTTLLLVALTAVSVLGDLFESMLKRQSGIKDSSNLLPGHGGVLDRIDSLTSTLPLAALMLSLGVLS